MITNSFIYGLFDPFEQIVRYVGQSIRPSFRLAGHLSTNPLTGGHALKTWTISLAEQDRHPCMIILEICAFENAHHREKFWHSNIINTGAELLNWPSSIHRTTIFRSSKTYKDRFVYKPYCILEPADRYRIYYPDQQESTEKFGAILDRIRRIRPE